MGYPPWPLFLATFEAKFASQKLSLSQVGFKIGFGNQKKS